MPEWTLAVKYPSMLCAMMSLALYTRYSRLTVACSCGHVQTPIEALSFYRQKAPDFIATIYESIAYLCLRDGKMMEFSGKQYRYDTQKFLQYCAKPA